MLTRLLLTFLSVFPTPSDVFPNLPPVTAITEDEAVNIAMAEELFMQSVTVRVVSNAVSPFTGEPARGSGSGTLYVKDGQTYVITAHHVIDDTREILVEFYPLGKDDETQGIVALEAEVVHASNKVDLALLKVKANVRFGKTATLTNEEVRLGGTLWHVGNIYGIPGNGVLSKGMLGKKNFQIPNHGPLDIGTNLPSAPGCSGSGFR